MQSCSNTYRRLNELLWKRGCSNNLKVLISPGPGNTQRGVAVTLYF